MGNTFKARAIASAGILSVLFGAFLAFAPAASSAEPTSVDTYTGNPTCQTYGYTYGIKDESPTTDGSSETVSGNGIEVTYSSYIVSGVRYFDFTVKATDATKAGLVYAVLVKQGDGGAIFRYTSGTDEGTVYVIPAGNSSATGISHLEFCHKGPSTTTTTASTSSTTGSTSSTTGSTSSTTATSQPGVTTTTATTPTSQVLGEGAENTTTTLTPTTASEEVLGETVTRTLPRTGSGSGALTTVGIALMAFGAVLVGGSRRTFADES